MNSSTVEPITNAVTVAPYLQFLMVFTMKWPPFVYVPLGIFGNVTTFLVTIKKSNRRISTCVYMTALSVVDANVLLSVFFYKALIVHGLGKATPDRFGLLLH